MDQEKKSYSITETPLAASVIAAVIGFLEMVMSSTLAKRVVAFVLLALGVPDERIAALAGLGERTVRGYRKQLRECSTAEDVRKLLALRQREKTRSKVQGLEEQIFDEIERNNCSTRKDIQDLIEKKFGISISLSAVTRLLKKGGSES